MYIYKDNLFTFSMLQLTFISITLIDHLLDFTAITT